LQPATPAWTLKILDERFLSKTKMERFLCFGRDIRPEDLTLRAKINMLVNENFHIRIGAMFA
jgi:hypothetical protein